MDARGTHGSNGVPRHVTDADDDCQIVEHGWLLLALWPQLDLVALADWINLC
jgi:hypothetical protein